MKGRMPWIDFKELRAKLDFERVLAFYGVAVKAKGKQHTGYCPLPSHRGKRNSPSFSANLARGIFQCFGCGAKGNLLDFAALMERADPKDGTALRQAAEKLQRQFCPELGDKAKTEAKSPPKEIPPDCEPELPSVVNAPLDFDLKELAYDHPYLPGRGFTAETIARFGLGFCSRGFLKGRIAIPLHGADGKLIGYCGRLVDDTVIDEENPKYRFPSVRKREGKLLEFRKSLFLYNGHRIAKPADDLIVVEGFASVWWLTQSGWPAAVATMGASCSEKQARLVVSLTTVSGRVWIVTDGDEAGERHAHDVLDLVARERFCRWVKLPTGEQPTGMNQEDLAKILM